MKKTSPSLTPSYFSEKRAIVAREGRPFEVHNLTHCNVQIVQLCNLNAPGATFQAGCWVMSPPLHAPG